MPSLHLDAIRQLCLNCLVTAGSALHHLLCIICTRPRTTRPRPAPQRSGPLFLQLSCNGIFFGSAVTSRSVFVLPPRSRGALVLSALPAWSWGAAELSLPALPPSSRLDSAVHWDLSLYAQLPCHSPVRHLPTCRSRPRLTVALACRGPLRSREGGRRNATPGSDASSRPRRGRRVCAPCGCDGNLAARGGALSRARVNARVAA